MRVFTFTEAGSRPENEDAFLVEPHPVHPGCLLIALADGQGGQAGGARAARVAVRAAVAEAGRHDPAKLLGDPHVWREVLHHADDAVMADPDAGFTTLVGFAARGPGGPVVGASSGDSAVLAVEPAGPTVWTEHQYKNPPVGSGEARFVPFCGSPGGPWVVLAMTDGVWKYAGWDAVTEAARGLRGQHLIDALAARTRLPGSGKFPDDFTVIEIESES